MLIYVHLFDFFDQIINFFYVCVNNKNQGYLNSFIYLGFYIAFNTVQVISRRVVGRPEETSTYSSLGFCTVNCQTMASNYQLSHLRLCWESNPGFRGAGLSKEIIWRELILKKTMTIKPILVFYHF